MPKEDEIKMWKNLTDSMLDERIAEFISEMNSDFVGAYRKMLHQTFINDEQLRTKIKTSFIRQAEKFSDEVTKRIIFEWEHMSDMEVSQNILDIYTNLGKERLDKICIYISKAETKNRIDKIIYGLIPKFRELEMLKMLDSWKSLSDEELSKEVAKQILGTGWTSSTSHFVFIKETYPVIEDIGLKARIEKILLDLSKLNQLDEESLDVTGRALYISIKLKLNGAEKNIITAVKTVDPTDQKYSTLVQWLNSALQEASVPEAEEYLVKQLNTLPKEWSNQLSSSTLPNQTIQSYVVFSRAYQALQLFNQKLAKKYKKKFQ